MNEQELKEHLAKLDKETIIELYLQKCFDYEQERERMLDDIMVLKKAVVDLTHTCDNWADRYIQLQKQLENAFVPKFDRQEHIYSVAFGEIKEFIVVAYLDNNTTLCEDTTSGKLEWCDNNFLVLTKEEAEAKLKELNNEQK